MQDSSYYLLPIFENTYGEDLRSNRTLALYRSRFPLVTIH